MGPRLACRTGAGNTLIGLAKWGVGTFSAAAEPETLGASTPLTIYGYVSGAGNFGAAFSDFYGAFIGSPKAARQGSAYSQVITSATGGLTYLATGNLNASATAANLERSEEH